MTRAGGVSRRPCEKLSLARRLDCADHPLQRFEAFRVEGRAEIRCHERKGLGMGHGRPVWPVGGQRLEDVGDRENAGVQGDRRPGEPPGIPLAVEPLMVRAGDLGNVGEGRDPRQDRFGVDRVELDRPPFDGRRRTGLVDELLPRLVGWIVHERRRDFAKFDGSQVMTSMIFQPCFLAVERNERMSAKSIAPSDERKPPEIFWRSFIMRPSRSA